MFIKITTESITRSDHRTVCPACSYNGSSITHPQNIASKALKESTFLERYQSTKAIDTQWKSC